MTTYGRNSRHGNRFARASPSDTAGLKWPPEICPSANTPVSTVSPKASATPANPMPIWTPLDRNFAASTALPQPPKTSQKVPRNSAPSLALRGGSLMSKLLRESGG